jgi:hypothetical protein
MAPRRAHGGQIDGQRLNPRGRRSWMPEENYKEIMKKLPR